MRLCLLSQKMRLIMNINALMWIIIVKDLRQQDVQIHIRCCFGEGHAEVGRMCGCSHQPVTLHHTIHHCPAVV